MEISISINEATRRAGIGRSTLYEAVGRGELRLKKVGRKSLVLVADLEAWVASWPYAESTKSKAVAA